MVLKIVTLTQIWTCIIYLLNVESCQLNACLFGQGTYVEGIKEEVVLSPAHALSLIASGEGLIIVPLLSSFPYVLYLQLPLVYSVFSPCTLWFPHWHIFVYICAHIFCLEVISMLSLCMSCIWYACVDVFLFIGLDSCFSLFPPPILSSSVSPKG